jgi:hypothetical protein
MYYLDASPMISALRDSPNSFEFTRGSLHHIPSRHRFLFDQGGRVRIDAGCDCADLAVDKAQEPALFEAFNHWRTDYWRPLEINRQFAAHFNPPSPWRQVLINLVERLHRALLAERHETKAVQPAAVAAK